MINLQVLRFGLPFATWLLVYHESITSMITVWSQSKTYEHGFLILPISLWLAWQQRAKVKGVPLSTAWLPVILFIVPSILWLVGRAADIALFEHVAAILSLQLMLWAMLGTPLTKAFCFPILYLVFCIPFGEKLVPYLQFITADISVFALQLTGIPVYREGLYLTIPNGLFEVAEACSGIRFLISSIALGTLFAYLHFNKWWKITLFIGFSFIFPVIANGIRAYGIILIGHLSDMEYATGADHLVYGWVFFSLVIAVIFYVATFFSDKPVPSTGSNLTITTKQSTRKTTNVTGSLTLMLLGLSLWDNSQENSKHQVSKTVALPDDVVEIESSLWGISFPRAQKSVLGITLDGKAELFSARYSLEQQDGELISSENRLYDKDTWSLSAHKSSEIPAHLTDSFHATQLNIINHAGQPMKILYWYCINDYCSNNILKIKLLKASWLISGQSGYADVLALASPDLSDEQLQILATKWMSN